MTPERWEQVKTLYEAVVKVVQEPAVASAMGRQGMENMAKGPADLAALVKSESAALGAVIKAAKIQGE